MSELKGGHEKWKSVSVCMISVSGCVCFYVQPAVSLNNPTCLGPPMIHSFSGNLQYYSEIKRSVEGKGGWDEDDEALQPSRLRPVVGAGFLLSNCSYSLDGLCTKRQSEARAAVGALKKEDYTWTMTLIITSLLDSARTELVSVFGKYGILMVHLHLS